MTTKIETKRQELKTELAELFPELKFFLNTVKEGRTHRIYVTVKGLLGSPYTMSEINAIVNQYNDNRLAGKTVFLENLDYNSNINEIKKMVLSFNGVVDWSLACTIANNECFSVLQK